jgi:hypothetical protein
MLLLGLAVDMALRKTVRNLLYLEIFNVAVYLNSSNKIKIISQGFLCTVYNSLELAQ